VTAVEVLRALTGRGQTLAVAESLTGGLLAATGQTMLVPFDFALNRPRRITPEEKGFLAGFTDEPAG